MPQVQRVVLALATVLAAVAAPSAIHPATAISASSTPVQAAECASEYSQWLGTYVGTMQGKKFTIAIQQGNQATYELTGVRKDTITARLEKAGFDAWWMLFGGSKLTFGYWPSCSGAKVNKFLVQAEFDFPTEAWVTRQQSQ
ncbi:hypothetical protein [Actinomadura fibrosa]|uniref:Uncharacterized protein n=1 Tax=Actinomadura fibrosa TaxID=111802 RepID=A0ABW2XHY0_9ACTN|nr:hypothetical protein [Actinomadura fibrosa]